MVFEKLPREQKTSATSYLLSSPITEQETECVSYTHHLYFAHGAVKL